MLDPAPRRRTLVMLSGGLDSTYVLCRLLAETDDEIVAHHIAMMNVEGRWQVEAERVPLILHAARRIWERDVPLTCSRVDRRGLDFYGIDMMTVGFEAGLAAMAWAWRGDGRLPDRWTIGTCAEEGHNERRFVHVAACCRANCWPNEPPRFELLLPLKTKAEQLAWLPPEIAALTWSCRRPQLSPDAAGRRRWLACGECQTCHQLATARAALKAERGEKERIA